ncbi:uncharacterized protein LOC128983927 [Macrosteles quadrilineatus]|uniref:uncharacterized protein LOC128983927 n=1 Tax=Macrosteles quadrilineatus TaxID=74068 RepID=UPI0023E14B8F|nr:uncharacterized protein LOC128983927 [Macrosteles quadrilineatus]
MSFLDDLQKAREKSNQALIRSDIETDLEGKKRKITKNRKYLDTDNDDSSSSDICLTEKEETPKKFKKALWSSKVTSSPLKIPGDLPDFDTLRRSPRKPPKNVVPSSSVPVPKTGSKATTKPTPKDAGLPSTFPGMRPSTSSSAQKTGTKTGNFEEICIRNQNIIKNYLRQILGECATLNDKLSQLHQQRGTTAAIEEESVLPTNLPITDLEELLALEDALESKAVETDVVNYLARMGGSNMADACRRALRSAILDAVACQYSWAGQKGEKYSALCD